MNKLHVKKDDEVVVISGDSKGTRGKVIAASPEEGKVIVAGANIVSKHTKARRQGLPFTRWLYYLPISFIPHINILFVYLSLSVLISYTCI